jgi:hypothetical protein
MPLFYARQVGPSMVFLAPLEGPVDPGFGGGRPGGVDPGYGIPGIGAGMPGHDLPGTGGHPWLPGQIGGGYPSHGLPGQGGIPGNELPSQPPPQLMPGYTLVLIRGQDGKWHYAAISQESPPPKPLPEPLPPDAGHKPIDPDNPQAGQLPGQTPQPKQ